MSRERMSLSNTSRVLAALAFAASSVALADDNSMSRWTGDSFAFFNDLDYSPGHFNMARARDAARGESVMKSPAKDHTREQPTLLAHSPRSTPRSPFRDDTGA